MKLNTKTIVGALLLWSFVAAQPAFSQSKQAAVSSDGAGLEVASAEALESAEPGQGQGSNGNLAGPSTGSNDATAEALAAEGVDAFEFESRGDFRRMAKLPVPGDGEGSSPNFPVKSPYGSPGSVKLLVPPTCFWGGTRFEVPRFS